MGEIKIKIPIALEKETGKLERELKELVLVEEKRKLLSLFIDEVMKGAKQLDNSELIELGREIKKGRFEKLEQTGLA